MFMLYIVRNSLLPYKHNTIHFSLHYFVGIPLVVSELSTQDSEPAGMSWYRHSHFSILYHIKL